MPSTKTVTVYKFEELSPTVQKKLIEKWQRDAHEFFEASTLTDSFKQSLEEVGLPSDDVNWSLSYSQGDGVGFYGNFSIGEYLKKNKLTAKFKGLKPLIDGMDINASLGRRSHHYNHWNNMTVDLEVQGDVTPEQEKLLKQLDEHIQEHVKAFSKQLEKEGYQEIEYQTSEEQARESLTNDDLDYDQNGRRV